MTNLYRVNIIKLQLVSFDRSKSVDLKTFYSGIQFRESMFENAIAGSIMINDAVGLRTSMPIVGEELLEITLNTDPDLPNFTKTFRIYKVSDIKTELKSGSVSYTLHFTSREFVENETKRIRKTYKNKHIEDIVQDLFSTLDSDYTLTPDTTGQNQNIVIRNMKPIQAINLMATYAKSRSYIGSLYFFYEDADGFMFKNLESLYQQPIVNTIRQQPLSKGDSGQDNAVHMSYRQQFDTLLNISMGMYKNKVIGLDLLSKTYTETTFDYAHQFDQLTHADIGSTTVSENFEDTNSQQLKFLVTRGGRDKSAYFKAHAGESSFARGIEQILSFRMTMTRQLMNTSATVSLPADTRYKAGTMVEVQVPIFSYIKELRDQNTNSYLDGKYLITGITHTIVGGQYSMDLSLNRDIYTSPIQSSI